MTTPPPQQALPPEIYVSIAGPIDQAMAQRIFNAGAIAINNKVQTIHAIFHSAGGNVGDGVALYNYFKSLPITLHFYNIGFVASIATIAFLGADYRHASATATFVIHKTHFNPTAPTDAARAKGMADSLEVDDSRTWNILKSHLSISDEDLEKHLVNELPFTAQHALSCGLITDIRDFTLPPGAQLSHL